MEDIVNVPSLIEILVQQGTSLEELVEKALRNLYLLEAQFLLPELRHHRNAVRATIAFVKVLYDCGQQMALARLYLLHKIKVLEVRESDRCAELSVLRDESPNSDEPKEGSQSFNTSVASEDDDVNILMDIKMIKDIDQSRLALQDISQLIFEKSAELQNIEKSMDDMACLLTSNTVAPVTSMQVLVPNYSQGNCGMGGTQVKRAECSPRVGDSRLKSHNHTNMADTMDKENILLPQGASEPPEAGTAASPTLPGRSHVRKSSEGTGEVVSASASPEKAATAEQFIPVEGTSVMQEELLEEISPISVVEQKKRKASESPKDILDEMENKLDRRPTKTRIVDEQSFDEDESANSFARISPYVQQTGVEKGGSSEMEIFDSSTPRRSERNKKCADFSQLITTRQNKNKNKKELSKVTTSSLIDSDVSSVTSVDRIIDPIVRRIPEEEKEFNSSLSSAESVHLSRSNEMNDSICEKLSKKSRNNKKKARGRPSKTVSGIKRRSSKPVVVSKEEAQKELQFQREDWLKMDGAALGARCLDHLEELDRLRSLSTNIFGTVVGRMKDSKAVATEITKALIEKISTVGDVYCLRNENFSLREELQEVKRKNDTQSLEIAALRKMISNLEREVRSLKDGFGPFPAASYSGAVVTKRRRSPEAALEEKKKGKTAVQLQTEMRKHTYVPDELASGTPGCSTNEAYMNRCDWPVGNDTTSWSAQMDVDVPTIDTKVGDVNRDKIKLPSENKVNLANSGSRIKKNIRIVENIQIAPPFHSESNGEEWRKGRKNKFIKKSDITKPQLSMAVNSDSSAGMIKRSVTNKGKPARRLIRPAVVAITNKDGGASYAEILSKAREKVSLKELGINDTVIRRALNGAIVIEVPGPMGKRLAGALSSQLSEALGDVAKVSNPVPTGELRIRGIDPSTTSEDILDELETLSSCPRKDFKMSPIGNMRDGMGIVWITCPIEAAIKIAECGVLRLGWTKVRVELLKKRPVQCFNCWHFGHVRSGCKSKVSRVGCCFRCGESGHAARACNARIPKCVICSENSKDFKHRLGSPRCLDNQGFPSGVQHVRQKPLRATAGGGQFASN